MKIKHFILIAALPAMAGCSQNEITDLSPEANPAIGFSVYTGTQTRATVADNASVQRDGFGILAYPTGTATWAGSEETPNFMYNQQVTYSDGTWSYSPLRYWPNNTTDKTTFFAYAPYATPGNGITLSDKTAKGNPEIYFTANRNPSSMVDLLTDETQTNKTSAAGTVNFKFSHILSRVNLAAKLATTLPENTRIVVTSMKLLGSDSNPQSKFYETGTYTAGIGTGTGAWATGKAFKSDTPMEYVILKQEDFYYKGYGTTGVILDGTTPGKETTLFKDGNYLFLIPPGTLAEGDIKLVIRYDIYMDDAYDTSKALASSVTRTVSLPAGAMEKGKAYKYTLTIAPDAVEISGSMEDWGEETDIIIPPLYNGKPANLLAIPGQTAYWVAPEDASTNIKWNNHLSDLCPAGWHVPTKDEFLAMTGLPDDGGWHKDNYDAIGKVFYSRYWSSTESGSSAWVLDLSRYNQISSIYANGKTGTYNVRCVRVK